MSKKLLLADDSITIQKVIGITFANEDYDLTIVDNGDAALQKARSDRPDLILADVYMPGKNGYEVCAAVKGDPALRGVPVLLLSGTFEPFDEEKAHASGADDWIAKPFESQALIDKVHRLLKKGAVTAAPSRPTPAAAPAKAAAAAPAPEALEEFEIEGDMWGELEPTGEQPAAGALESSFEEESAEEMFAGEEEPAEETFAGEEEPARDEDLWGAVSFEEEDLGEDLALEGAEEDLWGSLSDELSAMEAPARAAAEEEKEPFDFGPEEPAAGPEEAEEEILSLDEADILEAEELVGEEEPGLDDFSFDEEPEEELAAEGAWEEEEQTPVAAEELGGLAGEEEEAGPLTFDEEEFSLAEEGPEWGIAEEEPAAEKAFGGMEEEELLSPAEAAQEAFSRPAAPQPAATVTVEQQIQALSEEEIAGIVEKVAGSVVERLAQTMLEKIAWEVVPDLAESLIREEIRKIKEGVK